MDRWRGLLLCEGLSADRGEACDWAIGVNFLNLRMMESMSVEGAKSWSFWLLGRWVFSVF